MESCSTGKIWTRMANTFKKNIINNDGKWAAKLDGKGDITGLHEGMPGWIILDEFYPNLRVEIANFLSLNSDLFPLGWFSYATGPIAFAHQMQFLPISFSSGSSNPR